MRTRLFAAIALSSLLVFVSSIAAEKSTVGKKLIEYGWDAPDTGFVRANITRMEKMPLDGVVIVVRLKPGPGRTGGTDALGWRAFGTEKFKAEDFAFAIADLKAAGFNRFTDNFIQLISNPGNFDWFDDSAWQTVLSNVRILARIAKAGGCKGIMFDPEQYGHSLWSWSHAPEEWTRRHSFSDSRRRVRDRGREFIRAVNAEFPDITILSLFGPSVTLDRMVKNKPLEKIGYNLLVPFYDGIVDAATGQTTLIDGYEQSYAYRSAAAFADGRRQMLQKAKGLYTDPGKFARRVRAGFGLWLDNGGKARPWRPEDPAKNFFSPAEWQTALHYALKESDRYVWVYSEQPAWWVDGSVGPAYLRATLEARARPASSTPIRKIRNSENSSSIPHADNYNKNDRQFLDKYLADKKELLDLPRTGWKFKTDPTDMGQAEKWFDPAQPEKDWKPLAIGKFWEEQGYDYDGVGWYRLRFKAPPLPAGRRIFLLVGAVDESAWVWLNGKFVGRHDEGAAGWQTPFTVDITEALQTGSENLLVIRVLDRVGAGGLWKYVKIVAGNP